MKLSIIVPVFNGEQYLNRCLDSLLRQTYTDMEILVINDGSTDSTQKIASEYENKHNNIILINKENAGSAQARKTGLANAHGEYIGFVDVDDWVEPTMYEILLSLCEKHNTEISCSGFFSTYPNKEIPSNKVQEKMQIFSGKDALVWLNQRKKIFTFVWNKIYKKKLFDKITFPEGNFIGEDYTIVTQILYHTQKVAWTPTPLYHYVQIENSVSHGGYSDSYITAYKNYATACKNLSILYPEEKEYFENYFLTEAASFIVAMGKNNHFNYNMIKDIQENARTHKKQYIKASYIDIKYKLSIQAICIHYKILIFCYKIYLLRSLLQ